MTYDHSEDLRRSMLRRKAEREAAQRASEDAIRAHDARVAEEQREHHEAVLAAFLRRGQM